MNFAESRHEKPCGQEINETVSRANQDPGAAAKDEVPELEYRAVMGSVTAQAIGSTGCEWVVEAHRCRRESLTNLATLKRLFATIIQEFELTPIGEVLWYQFPGTDGITGMSLLAESHLACHTFPEFDSLCLNLFCCRTRPDWDFKANMASIFGAEIVNVRRLVRPYAIDV